MVLAPVAPKEGTESGAQRWTFLNPRDPRWTSIFL